MKIPFGIDCIHFGLASSDGGLRPLRRSEYLDLLKESLDRIPGMQNARVIRTNAFVDVELDEHPGGPTMGERRGAFPRVFSHRVVFEVSIPQEEQQRLLDDDAWLGPVGSTRFTVDMHPSYYGLPVVFVDLKEPAEESSPLAACIVLRRHLAKALPKASDGRLRLETLEELPLPAECTLKPNATRFASTPAVRFWWNYREAASFDQVEVECNPAIFEKLGDALEALHQDVSEELSLLYHVAQETRADTRDWNEIIGSVTDLADSLADGGWWRRLVGFFRWSSQVDGIMTKVTRLQVRRAHRKGDIDQMFDSLAADQMRAYVFRTALKRRLKLWPELPVDDVIRLAEYAGARREHNIALIVTAVVGVAAAALGAYVTAKLTVG